jgi:hypothetical protein
LRPHAFAAFALLPVQKRSRSLATIILGNLTRGETHVRQEIVEKLHKPLVINTNRYNPCPWFRRESGAGK